MSGLLVRWRRQLLKVFTNSIMGVPHIPILRRGQVYQSLDVQDLMSLGGEEPAAHLSFACADMVKRDLLSAGEARNALREKSCAELIEITKKAGEYFLNADLPVGTEGDLQSPDDYVLSLASTSGLPHSLIRMNMTRLAAVFADVGKILRGLTRGLDLDVIDRGYGEQGGAPVSFSAQTDLLSVILPSNSPAVNALWIPAIALKVPVVLKPGREEPWTPWRVIQAFIKAGCPPEAFSFYPTTHEGSNALLRRSGRVMMFGDDNTVKQHEHDPRVEVHGTGYSKILIGEDEIENWEKYIDTIVESISANSGRSCINTSTVVVPRYADKIIREVAKRLADIKPLAPDDCDARLSGFANPKFAESINGAIEDGFSGGGAQDVTAEFRDGDRFQQRDGMNYLLPTVVKVDSFDQELAIREFLFPFASFVECPQSEMISRIGSSLAVTAITSDQTWIRDLFDCPDIDRLNIGNIPTNRIQWDQPHEGNLFDFLYERRSFQIADAC